MSMKFYTRFVANLGSEGVREYSGIVELDRQERVPTDPRLLSQLIARDLSLDAEEVQVLHWSRLH